MIKNVFQTVKSHVSIFDVVSSYTSLKKAGHYFKGHCPFHSEKTASFTISPDKGIFYCFGCNEGGDAIAFIAKIERCSQLEAAHLLAEQFGIVLEQSKTYTSNNDLSEKKRYIQTCDYIARWCKKRLLNSKQALQYLESRSIGLKAIEYFTLGYMPREKAALQALLKDAEIMGILSNDIIHTGFLQKKSRFLSCPYEERIIFPIKSSNGDFCGFGGRILQTHDTRPKYYNTPENAYFLKSKLLFGLDLARKEIQKTESVFLVEGYTDCISMVNSGYTHTIATLGTACTPEHLEIISRHAKRIYVLYDSDSAGINACLKLANICWKFSLELFICQLPSGSDPAGYLEKQHSIKAIVEKAKDIFVFYLQTQAADFHLLALGDKIHRLRAVLQVISSIPDTLKQTVLTEKASSVFNIEQSVIKKECLRLKHQNKAHTTDQPNNKVRTKEESTTQNSNQNDSVIALAIQAFFAILHNVELYHDVDHKVLHYFLDKRHSIYLTNLEQLLAQAPTDCAFSNFYESLEPEARILLSKDMMQYGPLSRSQLQAIFFQIEKVYCKRQMASLKQILAKQAQEPDKTQVLLQEIVSLGKRLAKRSIDINGNGIWQKPRKNAT